MSAGRPTILHLRSSNFVGGLERRILRYCTGGAAAGSSRYRQILATFTPPGRGVSGAETESASGEGQALLTAARAAGVEAWGLGGGGWRDLAAMGELDRLVRAEGVRLICTHGYRADLLASWVARRRRIPTAWFLRGWTGEDAKVRVYEAADRYGLRWADAVVCLSQTQAEDLPARVPREKVRIVVNAIPAPDGSGAWFAERREAARAELGRRFGFAGAGLTSPLVAVAGRLSLEKGAAVFLEAVARAAPALDGAAIPARFLIFGQGPLRAALEVQVRRLGIAHRVRFAGFMAEWMRLLPGLDLLVNPSLDEPAANVVLEAMAARVPVLATAVGAVAEIAGAAIEGEAATPAPALDLVAPGDAAALSARLLALLGDEARRRDLARVGWERVRTAYSPERQQAQLDRLYRGLLADAAPSAPRQRGAVPDVAADRTPAPARRLGPTASAASIALGPPASAGFSLLSAALDASASRSQS